MEENAANVVASNLYEFSRVTGMIGEILACFNISPSLAVLKNSLLISDERGEIINSVDVKKEKSKYVINYGYFVRFDTVVIN